MQSSVLQKEKMLDSSRKLIGIPIYLWQLDRNAGYPISRREASLLPCQASRRIPKVSLQLDRSPDVTEQTRVLKGHPLSNSRIYLRFPPQLEKNHETSPSPRDEAHFPCSVQNNSVFPSKHERTFDFLDGPPESPKEHCHKSRETLRSPQQHESVL